MSVLPSTPFKPLGKFYIVLPVTINGTVKEITINAHNSRRLMRADQLLQMLEEAAEERKDPNNRGRLHIDKALLTEVLKSLEPGGIL